MKVVLWILGGIVALVVVAVLVRGLLARRPGADIHRRLDRSLQVSSPAFDENGPLPAEFSCEGQGGPPPLAWSNVPEGTRSFALVVTDPDIPSSDRRWFEFVHWVVYDVPADVRELQAHVTGDELGQLGAAAGRNGYGQRGYVAPCPVSGTRQYVYRLYALDVDNIRPGREGKGGVLKAMEGHVLAYGELVGVYQCTSGSGWTAMRRNMRRSR